MKGFSIWLSGGAVKGGLTYGATDEFGYNAVEKVVSVHDLHATMLHLLGVDHERLTFRYQGRDFRLTDVSGTVVKDVLT
jgi:arylsulfatase A-like enzyme